MGAALAIDYGRARIGVAASDALGITAQGIATLDGRDRAGALDACVALATERDATVILVGLPLHMDGTPGAMAREATAFADALRARVGCPVELVDERLTSFAADQALRDAGFRRKDRAKREDQTAAALLLRGWLDAHARGGREGEGEGEGRGKGDGGRPRD